MVEDKKIKIKKFNIGERLGTKRNLPPFAVSLMGLVLVCCLFLILTGGALFSPGNLVSLCNQAFSLILLCCGGIFVYSYGGLDMSLGGLLATCALVTSLLAKAGLHPILILLACMVIGVLSGMIIGTVGGVAHVPVFILSLSASFIFSGLVQFSTRKGQIYLPQEFISQVNKFGVKIAVLILVVLLSYYLFYYNRFGKYVRAIGGSEIVPELNGISVSKYIIMAHMFVGLTTAIAGFFSVARAGRFSVHTGGGLQIDVMIGLVLGGLPMYGGSGSRFSAVLIGAAMITVLSNGMILAGINPYFVDIISAVIFVVVVTLNIRGKPKTVWT